jgi:UDP-glucose 4-epimerase
VYGDQGEQPLREDASPFPRSPYAVSKLASEYYVRTIGSLWGIETVCLRIFNAYGPGQHLPPSHPPVVPNWLKQAVRGGSLVVHGDGKQTRDFIYINDVARALIAASTAPDVDQLVINVGSGNETRLRDLAQTILDVAESSGEILYTPRNDPGVSRMSADTELAAKMLGFQPRTSLEDGLKRTLEEDVRFQRVQV